MKSTVRVRKQRGHVGAARKAHFPYTAWTLSPSLSGGGNSILGGPEAGMDIDF